MREPFLTREFADAGFVLLEVVEELVVMDDHADPCRHDALLASVPYGADPLVADSLDALRHLRDGFSKYEPRAAAARPPEDADANPDPDRLTNEI